MKRIFADTCFWIALTNPDDGLHEAAIVARDSLLRVEVHTTDEILCEYLNYFAEEGVLLRSRAASLARSMFHESRVLVHPQSRATFEKALDLYSKRPDKGFSLVDCVSFQCMERVGIKEALTNDHHFEQAGFVALLRNG